MDISYPCGRDVIEQVLPHRDPFVWVSRVVACEPGVSITAELDVDPKLPLFAGHFPGHPVLPGVIIMEALAQTASFCALVGRDEPGVLGFFAGIDKAKFRNQVQPGDTLTLKATITRNSSRMVVADVEALVGDKVAATATQKYVMAKAEQ
ncbi:3-hydroxyacyl-ACP dehydratase FabZ [Senegalimassilia faecalis]|uniref:3-hydroxyacyl-[acyl-carrier-protein] dehydratase n=1 Tax=Senegalimassilia faecalis TaxID=2509433 RepID=A0A4Q2K5T2_9ACTN|nr:3-hydroxyacyl-ACP dehydratase FabZ [Senegalimassilia faecalis]